MGFTKLDDGLIFSSILREDDAVFKVWVLILSRTEKDGIARISPAFLASVCRKDDPEIERCLRVLESLDINSRSLSEDGRRIERVDGGFRVINYVKYRQRADAEEVREYEREKKRRQRADVPDMSRTEPGHSASASVSDSLRGGHGGESYYRPPGPANPLIAARRVQLEKECLDLVTEVASLTGEDPVEVIAQASGYKGAATTKLNPATMSDDRLANTVRDLRADAVELRKVIAWRRWLPKRPMPAKRG